MKEIMNKETGEIKEYHEPNEVLRSDVLVPYLSLMQALSPDVQANKVKAGDLCKNGVKYGDEKEAVNIIFLHYPISQWVRSKRMVGEKKFRFHDQFPRTAKNENLMWNYLGNVKGDEIDNGPIEWRRTKTMNVVAILLKDILEFEAEKKKIESGELPDPNKALTPVMITFRNMSYDAVKEVTTFYTQAQSLNVPLYRYSLPMMALKQTNADDESYFIMNIDRTKAKAVPKEFVNTVAKWAQIVGQVKAHGVEDEEVKAPPVAPAGKPPMPKKEVINHAEGIR